MPFGLRIREEQSMCNLYSCTYDVYKRPLNIVFQTKCMILQTEFENPWNWFLVD